MQKLTRRAFTKNSLTSLLAMSFLETFSRNDLFASSVKPLSEHWLLDVEQISKMARRKPQRHKEQIKNLCVFLSLWFSNLNY